MTRDELHAAVDRTVETTRQALQVLWDNINHGQQIQLYKVPEIRSLLERYGVEVEA